MDCASIISLGWFGHNNCGDEAFKIALQTLFPDKQFTFINNLKSNLELVNKSSYLLIGGGNILSREFLDGLESVIIPYSFIGVGAVPGDFLESVEKAEWVLARDTNTANQLVKYNPSTNIIPDITFCLSPDPDLSKDIKYTLELDPNKKTLGIMLNDYVNPRFDSTILKFIEAEKAKLELARFLEKLPYNIVFIPFSTTPPDDRRISLDVIGKTIKGYKHLCIMETLSPIECLSFVSTLDYAITMRLHASIFCTISAIPFLDIVHHDKSIQYLKDIGYDRFSLDYYSVNLKRLREKFKALTTSAEELKEKLAVTTKQNRENLLERIVNVHLP